MTASDAASMVITNVSVVDGTGAEPVAGADVVIRDGAIAEIGARAWAADLPVLDGAGRYLIPGLWETHAHLLHGAGGWVFEDENSETQAERNLLPYLRNGVTTVVDVGGPEPTLEDLRQRLQEAALVGPHLLLTGHCFTAPGGHPAATIWGGDPDAEVTVQTTSPQQAADEARRLSCDAGVAAIKIHYTGGLGPWPELPRLDDEVVAAIVEEARRHRVAVIAHIDHPDEAADVLRLGVHGIEHMYVPVPDRFDADLERVIELALASNAYWTMTLAVFEAWGAAGDESFLDRFDLEGNVDPRIVASLKHENSLWRGLPNEVRAEFHSRFEGGLRALPRAHAAGVRMAVGTDSGASATFHGLAVHRELEIMQAAGLAPGEALQAASRLAAQKFSLDDRVGTIAPGMRADLVLLRSDPLDDVGNLRDIEAVITAGRLYRPADLRVPDVTVGGAS